MSSEAIKRFIEEGNRSGLLSGPVAQDAISHLSATDDLTAEELASRLIDKELLTPYQAECLLSGHGDDCLIADRYRVLGHLGQGGMGAVYKARDLKLDRFVAIKVMALQCMRDADAVARFEREAKALARLSHPNIVQAFDSGEDGDRHFLVMEYIEGVTALKVLRDRGALTPSLAADFIHQTALGLEHAHARGLIHRDLKPGNLLVAGLPAPAPITSGMTVDYRQSMSAGLPVVKILDLGLARFTQDQIGESQLTQEGMGVGTPDYMAPEQFRDSLHADVRTDIYGLGCTLYHLIAGQVPFPGSSYSEKAQAHAKKEPIPLEERCPEVPAGLAYIVSRMMAKHPDERFASATQVAEALEPHVAAHSHSMVHLRQTGTWKPGRLPISRASRRRRTIASAVAVLLVVAGSIAFAWPKLFGPTPSGNASADGNSQDSVKPQVVTIENGWTVAKDGTGQFATIGEALAKVKPGQTIRVLDDARYDETITISEKRNQTGIALEGWKNPTLEATVNGGPVVSISGVPDVSIRGFRFHARVPRATMVRTQGACPGLYLERLDMSSEPAIVFWGVSIHGHANHSEDERPIVIRDCTIRNPLFGIALGTDLEAPNSAAYCARVIVRDNLILAPRGYGILIRGGMKQIQVVGNRVRGPTSMSAIQMDVVSDDSRDVLIANNSVKDCLHAFRIWDDAVRGSNIEFSNNLTLGAPESDLLFLDRRPQDWDYSAPADPSRLAGVWTFRNNWREGPKTFSTGSGAIPPSATDVMQDSINLLSNELTHLDFLRPAMDSPLATAGAGGDLPTYVGAVPPEGVAPWDWSKTWYNRHPKTVLTVSKAAKDRADFSTIGEALKAAKPKMTIRVLDDAEYSEALQFRDRDKHAGLTLEAPKRAMLTNPAPNKLGILILNVPAVTIRGFRIQADRSDTLALGIGGHSPGIILENLEFNAVQPITTAVTVEGLDVLDQEEPLVIRNCTIRHYGTAIQLLGKTLSTGKPLPIRGVVIHSCRIDGSQCGFRLIGQLKDIAFVGNCVWNCAPNAISFEGLFPDSARILLANNTLMNAGHSLEIQDPIQGVSAVTIRNNLVLSERGPDFKFLGADPAPIAAWQIDRNWREAKRPAQEDADFRTWLLSPTDQMGANVSSVQRASSQKDFLRPAKDSPLASGGAGGDLPTYVGALPPDGNEPWDWSKTWKARMK